MTRPHHTQDQLTAAAKSILAHFEIFSRAVIHLPLRQYQRQPAEKVIDSVLHGQGKEFLLIFPRQSGKNEAVAHLLVYLLNLLQRTGGNIVYAATGDGLGRGIQRLEERLENRWNQGRWKKAGRPLRRMLGKAAVVFLSSHPQAAARGETAHWLLIVDELQDQDAAHMEAVFEPMRAANNATFLGIGTVKTRSDALWRKKVELHAEEERDGSQRVFMVYPEAVIRENPDYGRFLERKIRKLGRHHPIVASEYYLEPIDGGGGLFPPRRMALMKGSHSRRQDPQELPDAAHALRVATIDIGGQDEASTDPLAQLANPGRDYTAATIFGVALAQGTPDRVELPVYYAYDIFVDQGSRHFQDVAGRPSLVKRLVAWLEMWQVSHLIVDSSGVGEGLVDWLCAHFGRSHVTGYDFQGRGKKAALGSAFLSLVETGRFKYWVDDAGQELSQGWWFWREVEACAYELPPNGRFERDLRWGVPAGATLSTPAGRQRLHDDRLISAALIAIGDERVRSGAILRGNATSAVIKPQDPLQGMKF